MPTNDTQRIDDFDGVVEVTTGPGSRSWPVLAVEAFLRARMKLAPDIHVVGPCTWAGESFSGSVRALRCGVTVLGVKPLRKGAPEPGEGLVARYAAFDAQTGALLCASNDGQTALPNRLLLRRGDDGTAPVVPIEGALADQLRALVPSKKKKPAGAKPAPANPAAAKKPAAKKPAAKKPAARRAR